MRDYRHHQPLQTYHDNAPNHPKTSLIQKYTLLHSETRAPATSQWSKDCHSQRKRSPSSSPALHASHSKRSCQPPASMSKESTPTLSPKHFEGLSSNSPVRSATRNNLRKNQEKRSLEFQSPSVETYSLTSKATRPLPMKVSIASATMTKLLFTWKRTPSGSASMMDTVDPSAPSF